MELRTPVGNFRQQGMQETQDKTVMARVLSGTVCGKVAADLVIDLSESAWRVMLSSVVYIQGSINFGG